MSPAVRGRERPAGVAESRRNPVRTLRVMGAIGLGALGLLPVWRLLSDRATGLAGEATVGLASAYASFTWAGFALVLIPALLAARFVAPDEVEAIQGRLARWLERPPRVAFSIGVAALALGLATAFGLTVLRGQPNLIDAMSQLLHARFLAAGQWAGPGPATGAFWQPQLSLFTPAGWVSHYPPGHVVLLAAGLKLGAAWAVGPLMLAVAVGFTALAAERLLEGRLALARLGALLVALSPFLIAHAGAYMSHTSAAAFAAVAVYAATRARSGPGWWAVGAGLAIGAMFATRPLSGAVLGLAVALWLVASAGEAAGHGSVPRSGSEALRRAALFACGALPFAIAVGAYNARFFGSPFVFGHAASLGPAGAPGFGLDPWGNVYGPVQALAYTSAELAALSLFLLETPLPLVGLVAVFLAATPRLETGERLLAAWALAPVAANLAYWHHGLFMGPRMLNETAPAWILLAVLSAAWLVDRLPQRVRLAPAYSPRVLGAATLGLSLAVGILVLSPLRLASHAQRPAALEAAAGASTPAVIFVHGGWTSRLAMRLAATGMRLDSVETALRQNPTCAVQRLADARADGTTPPELDMTPRAWPLPQAVEISPGNRIRLATGERLSGVCAREAIADRMGTIDVSPLLWRGDLPGQAASGAMFVRDLGPAENARLLEALPGRRAYVLFTDSPGAPPRLADYSQAMRALWGDGPAGGP